MSSRRSLVGLVAVSALLGLGGLGGAVPRAEAQDAGPTGEELFGTYALEARGVGVETSYLIEDLLPGGSPVLDLTIPETLARFTSGPTGYGLASLAYPGGIIVNLASLIEATGSDASQIPPYPIKAEAFFPSGPTSVDASQPGGLTQRVVSGTLGVEAAGEFPGVAADPAVNIGSIRSVSRSTIEEGKAVSRTRVAVGDVKILGGLIGIDSVVTDLVAVHDGKTGSTAGTTKVSGVQFLGLAATITEEGLVLDKAPAVEGPAADLGILGPLVDQLNGAANPLIEALNDVLAQVTPSLNPLLAAAGIEIKLLDPKDIEVASGASTRTSSGLSITISYKGEEQKELRSLLESIPAELKPSLGPLPNPVSFLANNHIAGFNVAPASVSALATPPFDVPPLPSIDPGTPADAGGGSSPGFETPLPDLPAAGEDVPALDTEPASVFDGAVPALLVALALLASPFFGFGSTKLADNVLAPVSTSCPTGQDKPPPARLP